MSRKVVIAGASGRMGRALIEAVTAAPDLRLFAALERAGSPFVGRDAGELVGAPAQAIIHDDLDGDLGPFTEPAKGIGNDIPGIYAPEVIHEGFFKGMGQDGTGMDGHTFGLELLPCIRVELVFSGLLEAHAVCDDYEPGVAPLQCVPEG